MDNRRREPASVSSVTQHVLRGTLDTQVQADIAYTVDGHIKFHLGPVFLVLKGREAALSMRELIDKLTPVIDEMYPDLDAELRRQHREILRQATLTATAAPASTAPNQPPSSWPARPRTTSPPDTTVPGLGTAIPRPGQPEHIPYPRKQRRASACPTLPAACPHAQPSWTGGTAPSARSHPACSAADPALCRSPVTGRALPQGLRRDLDHHPRAATRATVARLIRRYTPGRGEPR